MGLSELWQGPRVPLQIHIENGLLLWSEREVGIHFQTKQGNRPSPPSLGVENWALLEFWQETQHSSRVGTSEYLRKILQFHKGGRYLSCSRGNVGFL